MDQEFSDDSNEMLFIPRPSYLRPPERLLSPIPIPVAAAPTGSSSSSSSYLESPPSPEYSPTSPSYSPTPSPPHRRRVYTHRRRDLPTSSESSSDDEDWRLRQFPTRRNRTHVDTASQTDVHVDSKLSKIKGGKGQSKAQVGSVSQTKAQDQEGQDSGVASRR